MRVEILDAALAEASDAASYYGSQLLGLGDDFLVELDRAIIAIGEQPEAWPTLGRVQQRMARRFLLSRFPYSVVYLTGAEHAVVVAVAHSRRRPGYWTSRIPPAP